MQKKIYIAGQFEYADDISSKMRELEKRGFLITHDWTKFESYQDDCVKMGKSAELDIDGVKNAEILICVMTDGEYEYRGTFTEIGCALGLGKKIIIINNNNNRESFCMTNCFYHHPAIIHVDSWEECLKLPCIFK
ncbi:MAG: hypothetical protein A2096_04040 [Spirochaetes bacterium GWF1_41_5]|nr:MAG: hypothetical protein A2096_04040 [Spirochaetes bacterium GWF1_41_5]